MVRRDATDGPDPSGEGASAARCASPAGGSPVPVGVGAPGSRPQVSEEDLRARAGRRKPVRRREPCSGEQARGPQHEVKPAASTEEQSGSRAAHVTAKATSSALVPKRAGDSGGVWGAARVQGEVRNTRGPSVQPQSRQGGSYKPKAKSSAAQRESEGIVVPETVEQSAGTNAVQNNAAGGKGPCGGHADGAGKREGMAGRTGPNDPDGRRPCDKVQQLQRQLWAAAKRAPGRRFHALYDHIWRRDVLQEAWKRVRRNRGAAGVDGQSIRDVEQYGIERFLEELGAVLRAGRYRAEVVRRRYIPKADGKKRPLGIPTVRDRVVQMAAKLMLEPVFEADFLPCWRKAQGGRRGGLPAGRGRGIRSLQGDCEVRAQEGSSSSRYRSKATKCRRQSIAGSKSSHTLQILASGARGRNRTTDTRIFNPLLYP